MDVSAEHDEPGSLTIRDSRAFYAYWCIAMTLLAVATVTGFGWGPFGLVLFGGYALWALTRLLDRRPRIRVTPEGIIDDNFWYSPGLVRWADILDVRMTRLGLIEVDLRDENAFWERLSPLRRLARFKMQLYGFGPALITPWGLEGSGSEIVAHLQAGLDEHVLLAARSERSPSPSEPAPS